MVEGAFAGEVRQAVEELQAYLSDLVAPLLVADSAELLSAQSPAIGVETLRAWVAGQMRGGHAAVDLLVHAIRKIHHLGDLKLVSPEPLQAWLEGVIDGLVTQAPLAEQSALRAQLMQACAAEVNLAAPIGILQRADATAGATNPVAAAHSAADAVANEEMARNLRQFALLLSRLAPNAAGIAPEGAGRAELAPQILATAAQSARTQQEFEQFLASISKAGLMKEVRLSDLFSTLSRGLPDWFVGGESGQPAAYLSAPVQAMHKIVAFAEDPAKATAHFRELFKTAAQQFNEGALGRAVQVLEVAQRLLAEKRVDKTSADLILGSAHEDLDTPKMMAQTQDGAHLQTYRRMLNVYPALTPQGLLLSLDNEPDRSKRRLWIALLEVHGPAGRQAALERLTESFADPNPPTNQWMLDRNFVYLLHRIPPREGADTNAEVSLSIRCSEIARPAPLVREAIINLGMRHGEAAEGTLRQRLQELEAALESPAGGPHEPTELWRMLGLVTGALVRQGTVTARRAVVEHGLKQKPQLGDTLTRLAELGGSDLSSDPHLVDRLLAALQAALPVRVLGLRVRGGEDGPQQIIKALSGTRSPAVHAAFEDIVKRFADPPFAASARAALAAWESGGAPAVAIAAAPELMPEEPPPVAAAPTVGLSGDLEVFGLPELMQTLSQMQASGRLSLRDRKGAVTGELFLREGLMVAGRVGRLKLPDAFYQLLEAPVPGTFEFSRQPADSVVVDRPTDVMALLMEGMRRYDELQRSRALVPDNAYLKLTGTRPAPFEQEGDGAFIREVWTRVKDGATPREIESAVAADDYRLRALLAHWMTQGALEIHEAPASPPP